MNKVSKNRQSFNYRALSTEVEVKLAPFSVFEDCVIGFWLGTSC